jgi:hypothetical protein
MTMRDCRGLESSGGILSVCLDRVLRRIGVTRMDPDRAVRAAHGFDRYREWWLMIDGLDDPGDERLVVPVIRELKMLIRDRGMHVITNARTQNLANILFRARIDEDLRDALRPFRVYSLRGLSPGGSQAMLGAMSRAKEPAAAELNALLGCGPTQATFATLVLRHPGSLTQLADFHASQPARCDSGAAAMREWLLTAKFEAYCRSELCGSDVQKQELRDLIGCFRASVQGSTSSVSRDWIANTLLDKRSCSVKEDRYHNVESVLRALMEIGLVHAIGLDEFEVVREWSG